MYVSGIAARAAWADDLVRHYAPSWQCVFYLPKSGKARNYTYGHACPGRRRIELAVTTTERTTNLLWIVLHEIAHAIHDDKYRLAGKGGYYNRLKPRPGCSRRSSLHPPAFWRIAVKLYRQVPGMVEYAAEHEYKRGRKYINKILARQVQHA